MADSEVIIPTRNRPDDLRTCLEALAQQTRVPHRVIIVDSSPHRTFLENGRTIASSGLHHAHVSSLAWASHQRNVGLGLLHNSTTIVHLLDDDVRLFPDYLELVEEYLDEHPGVVAVGGRNRAIQMWRPKRLKLLLRLDCQRPGSLLRNGVNVQSAGPSEFPVDWLSGCIMSVQREALRTVRYRQRPWKLDPDRGLVGEDVNISLDLARHGTLVYLGAAEYDHSFSQVGRAKHRLVGRLTVAHRMMLATTHPGRADPIPVLLGALAEAVWEWSSHSTPRQEYAAGLLTGVGDLLRRPTKRSASMEAED